MRNLLFALALCLTSGCIFTLDDGYYDHHHENTHDHSYDSYEYEEDVWFETTDIYCTYDYNYGESYWEFYAVADSYYSDISLVQVNFYGSAYSLYDSWDVWSTGFWSYSFDCNYSYDIDFVAYDYDGNWVNAWTVW